MDIDPMNTLHQRDRRGLEIARYPHLDEEIVRRDEAWCQHMTDRWQTEVIDMFTERLIPARSNRPVAFTTFGHWGPWAYAENWGGLANAIFVNEASMISWLIASYHVDGSFLHSQCCVLGLFCYCLRQSIPLLASMRKRLLWTRLHQLLQCMICRERRFEWGLGTTRQYLGIFIDRVSECLDFATFVISSNSRFDFDTGTANGTVLCQCAADNIGRTITAADARGGIDCVVIVTVPVGTIVGR